jgi:peptidoglycan-N-acetylglucosamine deacetylase
VKNALSVDVEDWFQVGAFENNIDRGDWDKLDCRVEHNTDAVLAMFDEGKIKGTFFILGWIAARYPQAGWKNRGAGA